MSELAQISNKLKLLIRLLSSDKDGEVLATVAAIKRTLESAGSDFHQLADALDSDKKFSESEAHAIYQEGRLDGRREVSSEWLEIVRACETRVRYPNEPSFVKRMHRLVSIGGEPTEREAAWLRKIYARGR